MNDTFSELDRRQNESLNRRLEANNAEHGKNANPGGEGGSPSKLGLQATGATGLKEKSTGGIEIDKVIKDAGAIPAGKMANLALFHDPKTGSTLALDHRDVTPENVLKHLTDSRAKFGVK